jgi:hypothetical protein
MRRESQLLYDWRFTALETHGHYFFFLQLNTCGYSPYVTSSVMRWIYRLQLLLVLASTVILGFKSRWTPDHTLSDSRLPRIYVTQWQSGKVIHQGTGFHFCRLLRLTGLHCRDSTPTQHGFHLAWRMHFWLKKMIIDFYTRPDITSKLIIDALIVMTALT